ncbi:uncharacterized protein LOC115632416 [Scaptodrosophila lebanonensis]|uniref:Uncharacterized protein LOC115632416 n=1 Tax=Drosophila lebanonensis TaxID=7225 RepID=A0A6J2UD99_DROLE|nr:uncharacterized protein LOC115632416 [Scaptodrosophila lebanonensis]
MRVIYNLLALLQLLAHTQGGHVQQAKRHMRAEIREALGHADRAQLGRQHHYNYHGSHWHNGKRVHRLHMPHQRWSGRWRSMSHHQPFSRWTQWTSCDKDCVKQRERYCKAKRKCGHTKHVEHRKCLHCHPQWHEPSHKSYHWAPSVQSNPPSIVINAAAAAASGPTISEQKPHLYVPTNSMEVVHRPPTHHPHPPRDDSIEEAHRPPELYPYPPKDDSLGVHRPPVHHPYTPKFDSKEVSYRPPSLYPHTPKDSIELVRQPSSHYPSKEASEEEDIGDFEPNFSVEEGDFFVLKRKKRIKQKHKRKQRRRPSPKPVVHHNDYDDDDSAEDFEDYLDGFGRPTPALRMRARNLNGVDSESSSLEGDVFQYKDFDFEQSDLDFEQSDSEEYADIRNASSLSSAKERNTPDAMTPRHRRIYSKWSRWTKCSPKCTTRRFKKCRVSERCGREVLREIAYCYTEGSFCQQWLQTEVQRQTPAYETRPARAHDAAMRRMNSESSALTNNAISSDFIMNGKGYRGPEYAPPKLRCGQAPVRSARRNMYNMLKIIGGKAARKGEWPWQVAIFNRFKEAFCGGTLIAPSWVLTAAHCVRRVLYVRIGEHNLDYEDGTEIQLRVLKSFKHPSFDKRTVDSDVALLRLPKPVNASTWIGYSCMPRPYQPLPKNMECTVIGWGKRRNHDVVGTSVLHQAEVPIIPMANCRSVYHDYTITKNMFCAGHQRGRIDTCAGDSGGPLLCRDTTKPNHPWTIFGITSFGDGCAKRNKFGIYAKVPNYVDWVWSVVNCNGNCKHQRAGAYS